MSTPRLLVVEDHAESRDILVRYFARQGFVVEAVEDAAAALEAIATLRPDLVLLDIMMPDMSGLEALFLIRQTLAREELPVVMVTAKDSLDDVVEALALGANDFVTKPLDLPTLGARVRAHLRLATRPL